MAIARLLSRLRDFNPTIVLLKLGLRPLEACSLKYTFQSYNSSIKTIYRNAATIIVLCAFQSYNSSIKTV